MLLRLLIFILVLSASACSLQAQQVNNQAGTEPAVNFTEDLIEAAALSDGSIWLKLTQEGQKKLQAVTRELLGKRVNIAVLGHQALSLLVVHEIDSGRLVIDDPSSELETALGPYLVER